MNIRDFKDSRPTIHETAYIDASALVIGAVTIGEHSSVWPMAVVRGDVNAITIGARSNIQDGAVLHVAHGSRFTGGGYPLAVGDDVTVGHRVILHACVIGNACLIGMAATIMDGSVVEDRVIVGAGSLVPIGKTLKSGHLYIGSPARQVRPLNDDELAFLEYSAGHYARLKEQHKTSLAAARPA